MCSRCGLMLCYAFTDMLSMFAGSSHQSPDHADAQNQLQRNAAGKAAHQTQDPAQSDTLPAAGGDAEGGQQPDGSDLAASQEAAQSSEDDSSATPRVPPELRAVTAFLRDKQRLRTPGLFVNSADAAMLWAMHQPPDQTSADSNREPKAGCALAVKQVREALDRGQQVMPWSCPEVASWVPPWGGVSPWGGTQRLYPGVLGFSLWGPFCSPTLGSHFGVPPWGFKLGPHPWSVILGFYLGVSPLGCHPGVLPWVLAVGLHPGVTPGGHVRVCTFGMHPGVAAALGSYPWVSSWGFPPWGLAWGLILIHTVVTSSCTECAVLCLLSALYIQLLLSMQIV